MTAFIQFPTSSTDGVRNAIANASRKTGVDFSYLLGQANIESGLRPDAKAATSSATGLFQFVDQSWLAVMSQHGQANGLGWASNAIQQTSGGRYYVADPAMRQQIMNLRKDPETCSIMAAEHAADNKAAVEGCLGRTATGTDLYICHFLGQKGGQKFLSAMQNNAGATAASLFPAAGRANRNVFYNKDGSAKTLAQVYDRFAGKLGQGAASSGNSLPGGNGRMDTATLNRLQLARMNPGQGQNSFLRPSPDNARTAYLMLANLGA
ncbi:lytic transglycosylase domain-containing protein [Sphingomonas sp. ID0503]|uniref:lytic transglycosylase domain-containing protein n=1 Tax=Sphingomonas sp. ID0503 TaxID=3399691 RepID=UPI003AFB7D9B